METDIIHSILHKKWGDLSKEERLALNEICASKEEFVLLQTKMSGAVKGMHATPKPKVKESLDALFAAQYFPKATPIWYNKAWMFLYPAEKQFTRRPLVQIAAVAILFLIVTPFIWNTSIENNKQLAQTSKDGISSDSSKDRSSSVSSKGGASSIKNFPATDADVVDETNSEQINPLVEQEEELKFTAVPLEGKSAESEATTQKYEGLDGVFTGNTSGRKERMPLNEQEEVLDVLTALF